MSTVGATTIAVRGGNHANEDSSVEFRGNVASTNLNITGSTTAGATAGVTFTGSATSRGAITLNDGGTGSTASVTFGNISATVQAASISASSDSEGTVRVIDANGGAATVQRFSAAIGGATNATRVGTLAVGGDNNAGQGEFDAAVRAATITVTGGNAASEASNAQFDGTVDATTVHVTSGGNATADASATFNGTSTVGTLNVVGGGAADADTLVTVTGTFTGNIALNDTAGDAGVVFSGTAARTVTGNITATRTAGTGGAGTETVVVNNTAELTFIGDIGTSATVVDSLMVGSTQANSALKTRGSVYAGLIMLGSGAGTQSATLTLEADTDDQTVMGAVTGDADDTVTVSVWDRTHGAAADTATFNSALSNIDTLNIGSTSGAIGGSAVFVGTVGATTIAVHGGNHAAGGLAC